MQAPPHDFSFCQKYGFDGECRQTLLALIELTNEDIPLVERMQCDVIVPNLDNLITDFYNYLQGHDVYQPFLRHAAAIKMLHITLRKYLETFGVNFYTEQYFDSRLKVGSAHQQFGMPLSLYQCAYRYLEQYLVNCIPQSYIAEKKKFLAMQALIHKIMTLDMTLAIETYHWSKVREMEMSISDLRSREHVLLNKAQTDSLTGLMNRAYLSEMLQQTLKTATRHERISAMMLDIDFFKTINDSYGHQTGDDVLVEVGRRMQRAVRDRDDVARYGGEEFFILLRNIDFARARVIAERLRRLISDHPFHIQGLQIDVTLSIGLTYLRREDSAESFIARADKALYDAKHQGRNCVVVKE